MRSSCPKCSAVGAVKRIAYSLGLGHRPVFTATGEQFLMAAALDDPARFHHQNDVRITDRRKPMRDNETRTITAQFAHCVLNQQLGTGVHGTGGLVENEQLRPGQESAGDRDSCFSPALMLPPSSLTFVW